LEVRGDKPSALEERFALGWRLEATKLKAESSRRIMAQSSRLKAESSRLKVEPSAFGGWRQLSSKLKANEG
jgi:hypothetical protein